MSILCNHNAALQQRSADSKPATCSTSYARNHTGAADAQGHKRQLLYEALLPHILSQEDKHVDQSTGCCCAVERTGMTDLSKALPATRVPSRAL